MFPNNTLTYSLAGKGLNRTVYSLSALWKCSQLKVNDKAGRFTQVHKPCKRHVINTRQWRSLVGRRVFTATSRKQIKDHKVLLIWSMQDNCVHSPSNCQHCVLCAVEDRNCKQPKCTYFDLIKGLIGSHITPHCHWLSLSLSVSVSVSVSLSLSLYLETIIRW